MHAKRYLAALSLIAVVVVVGYVVLRRDPAYRVTAQFTNAGQLVKGDLVQVAGRPVGHISGIRVGADGLADVVLRITDSSYVPLHEGSRVRIRALGQAGVANRYVDLMPGSTRARNLPDNYLLPPSMATGIVDLDEVLNALNPPAREDVRQLIRRSSAVFAGSNATYFNRTMLKLRPALGSVDDLLHQVTDDRLALDDLVASSGRAATAIAARKTDLEAAVSNTAASLHAIQRQRESFVGVLKRTPRFVKSARLAMRQVRTTATALRPTLRAATPVGPPLKQLLVSARSSLPQVAPVLAKLTGELPSLRTALNELSALRGSAVPAFASTAKAAEVLQPIVRGLRIYGADFILGIFNGLTGIAGGEYQRGHYARLEFTQNPQTLLAGPLASLLSKNPLIPGLFATRTGLDARCPGGNQPPAPDGSSPWVPDPTLCDPLQSVPAAVNTP
jgi:phospholipid/cholesterol/gamma-HCH transport system substrate-binding protein